MDISVTCNSSNGLEEVDIYQYPDYNNRNKSVHKFLKYRINFRLYSLTTLFSKYCCQRNEICLKREKLIPECKFRADLKHFNGQFAFKMYSWNKFCPLLLLINMILPTMVNTSGYSRLEQSRCLISTRPTCKFLAWQFQVALNLMTICFMKKEELYFFVNIPLLSASDFRL